MTEQPIPRPVLDRFTVEWDPLQQEWLARSESGAYLIRGRGQAELEARRWELYGQVLARFRAAIAEVFPLRDI